MPIFVILAQLLPIFGSIFGPLDRPYAKESLCRIEEPSGPDGEVGRIWVEVPLLKSPENDSDL